ncbi:MAG TPA: SpvB/TcaC N-terminal domain-containing protein, partial [Thermoanaerobaculia bacterium]|nr:SpvB/TcaC N-terminal domain-containing protein [Thermoanaerobaculia bacterium]
MSERATAGQSISLPKGGGALQGIGEKFSPDLHSGTGNFTIPLELPRGRNGLQPELRLAYSTGSGNGPFGLGWNVAVPAISRKTAKGVPRYRDGAADPRLHDTFVLSGGEDLVAVPGGAPGVQRYRPRTEGLFARIEHHRATDHWEVTGKDGLLSRFGTFQSGEVGAAVVADPAAPGRVFAWKLTETVDPFGNRVEYRWRRDRESDASHLWDQLYLEQVRWVDYRNGAGEVRFLLTVDLDYEDRPDPFSDHRAGFEVRTRQRCVRIALSTHAGEERLVRSWELAYLDQRPELADLLPANAVSLLSRVRVAGHDGGRTQELPPLDLGYTRFEPAERDFFPLSGRGDLPARSLADRDLELVDLFGNGLPDILEMNGSVRYWRNRGGGSFDLPREMATAPAGLRLGETGVQLLDADGDGRADLLVSRGSVSGFYPLAYGGLWDRRSFRPFAAAPTFSLEDPEVRLVDLNGDGVTDAIRAGSRLECFFQEAHHGWSEVRAVERRALAAFPDVNFSDPRVRWADMGGDGLQDVVLVHDGRIEYWPSQGWGDWGRRVVMRHSPRLPEGYDPRRILLGDVDGDGAADLLYVEDGRVTLWINRSGEGWSAPVVIRGTPPVSDTDSLRLADVLGNGIAGLLWSADAGRPVRDRLHFLDFTGGTKPYLLDATDNHAGAQTRIGYASSTRHYLADEARPGMRWRTPLPFPVQVVARVEMTDGVSGGRLVNEYTYHHGYWDGAEREFRGFGRVDQLDTFSLTVEETVAAPPGYSHPLETRTWFYQGPVGDELGPWEEPDRSHEYWPEDPPAFERPAEMAGMLASLPRRARREALRTLRGRVLRTEVYARDGSGREGRPYLVSETLHGVREEAPPADGDDRPRIFFPHPLAERSTEWERGAEPRTRYVFTGGHDAWGQPRSQLGVAAQRAGTPGEPYLVTHTVTTYAEPAPGGPYILDRVARVTVQGITGTAGLSVEELRQAVLAGSPALGREVLSETLAFYDGAAFEGLPLGRIGAFGAAVRAERLVATPEILAQA